MALILAITLALPAVLQARGGGGCLEQGTPVDTPNGAIAVESLHVGDTVWGWANEHRIKATVEALYIVHPAEFIEISADERTVRLTAEHPVETAPGTFVRADRLVAGQMTLFTSDASAMIAAIRRVPAAVPAYNLLVSPGGVFFANGFAVHNKGCFLPDTPILMMDGTCQPISTVRPGDRVLAFDADEQIVRGLVHEIITHEVDSYLVIRTDNVELHVTEEHPFYVGAGVFRTAEALAVGDPVYVYDGHRLAPQAVRSIEHVRAHVTVYNLHTDEPHTFLANGVAVHNKGGGGFGGGGFGGGGFRGGYGRSGYYGGSSSPAPTIIFLLCIAFFIWVAVAKQRADASDEELDYCFSRSEIDGKAQKTMALLNFISHVDSAWTPQKLQQSVRSVFLKLQACWSTRSYAPMEPLLMRDLYEQHCTQLRGLRETHEINRIDQLTIEAIDFVHVHYAEKTSTRWFTALITARAKDYYVDDRTNEFIRGDGEPQRFQEFWTFQLCDGNWRLREIEQTKESDALTTENFFEQFTDVGRDQIYGATAGQTGPTGPALPADVQSKSGKIERLLNFLVQTDKIWNRDEMLATARRVFLNVQLAWQDGRPEMLTGIALSQPTADRIRHALEANRQRGVRVEHRNFCVRKVEIVHVDNRDDRKLDNFTARITAHAQTIVAGPAGELYHDEWVKAWTEFWTFGRDGDRWVLTEILPEIGGQAAIARENIDEGSSQQMMEWYYSKTRAN